MLNRQKVLLAILREAQRPVSKIELMKMAFILRHEAATSGGAAFYEFLPYQFGPYSFGLDREIRSLCALGFVAEVRSQWQIRDAAPAAALPSRLAKEIAVVVRRFASVSTNAMLDAIYRDYPAFTVNSLRQRMAARPVAPPGIYTAGYEGLQIDAFLNLLVTSGMKRLIDVRNNPVARRFGFHKSTLSRLCGLMEIDYVHVAELGIVSAERQNLTSHSDYEALFENYEDQTLTKSFAHVEQVAELLRTAPSALVCMEANAQCCHRSRLAAAVKKLIGLEIVHLRAD